MPDINSSSPTKTALPVPIATKAQPGDSGSDQTDDHPVPPPKGSFWAIGFGVLALILGLIAAAYRSAISDRDTTIAQDKNRADQHEAATVLMQAQLDSATAGVVKLQAEVVAAKSAAAQLTTQVDQAKAGIVEIQAQLDKSRTTADAFQSQMETAKVDSIRHQGEAEAAQAQTNVLQEQMNEAKTDTARLQTQLDASRVRNAALQESMVKDEAQIAQLQKAAAKS